MKQTSAFMLAMIVGFIAGFSWVMIHDGAHVGPQEYAAY